MTSQAISGLSAALYRDDPTAASVAISNLPLTCNDGGLYQTYQAAVNNRYWDPAVVPGIQYKLHGGGSWLTVTPDAINYLRGSVYFITPRNNDDTVQVLSGSRRSESNFQKVINLYAGKLRINGKEIDITSVDSQGWEEKMPGNRSFEFTAEAFFYYNVSTYPEIDTRDLMSELIAKFYSNYSGAKSWVGRGMLKGLDLILNDPNKAQQKTLTFAGKNEIYPE